MAQLKLKQLDSVLTGSLVVSGSQTITGSLLVSSDISVAGGNLDFTQVNGTQFGLNNLSSLGYGFTLSSGSASTQAIAQFSSSNGNAFVGIGTKFIGATAAPIPKTLTVQGDISASGTIYASQFNDDGTNLNVPDYVFEPEYKLKTLPQVEQHISQSKHLPGMPPIEDKNGWKQLSVGDRDMKLLEKIEELTLYIIDLHKRIEKLEKI